jgi:hypothetical protein
MPPIQTSYSETVDQAVAGQIGNMVSSVLVSRTVEDAAGVAFGLPVAQGSEDEGVIAYAGADFVGITVRERSVDPSAPNKFAQYDNARVLRKGAIWVTASKAVDAGDNVYLTDAGAYTNVEGSNFQIPGARWDTSTSGAALALVVIL